MKKLKNLKSFIWVLFIAAFIGLASSIPNTYIQAVDATFTRYFIWENDSNRNAATADSLMGFVNGNDTAIMVPMPVSGTGYWVRSNDSLFPLTSADNFYALDSVYFTALPIGEKDSIIYIDGDTLFKGEAPSGGVGYWTQSGDSLFPATSTDNFFALDSVYFSGLPIGEKDSIVYWDNDTLFKGPAPSGEAAYWTLDGDSLYTDSLDWFVGIGVTEPSFKLDVNGDINITTGNEFKINGSNVVEIISNSSVYGSATTYAKLGNSFDYVSVGGVGDFIVRSGTKSIWMEMDNNDFYIIGLKCGFGTTSPDSTITSVDGGSFPTDILVGGGWQTWTPTITFTGGTLSTAPTVTARYSVTNNVVTVNLYIRGENDSGNTLTAIQITPPFYPPDINSYANFICAFANTTTPVNNTRHTCLLDMTDGTESNRIIYTTATFSLVNSDDYNFVIDGTYEITGK